MPYVTENQESQIRRNVRDIIAIDPLISERALQASLEKKIGRTISREYIRKLIRKVQGEIIVRVNEEDIGPRLGAFREEYRIARESLLRIAYGEESAPGLPKPTYGERIAAWRAIGTLGKIYLDAELDIRSRVKKDGQVIPNVQFRYAPLPESELLAIVDTMRQWGINPPEMRQIEAVEVKTIDVTPEAIKAPEATPEPIPAPIKSTLPAEQKLVKPQLDGGFQIIG